MKVEIEISDECIAGALYGAFDSGGVHYWAKLEGYEVVAGPDWCLAPMHGGHIVVACAGLEDRAAHPAAVLDGAALKRGLQLMAGKHPKAFAALVKGDYDANIGDELVQLAVFGELVFG